MALHKTRAVVIGRRAFGESDRLVDFYTRDYGKVRGIARAARRVRSRFGSSLELFTLGEMVFFDTGRSELVQVDHFDIVRPFVRVREHLERLGQARGRWRWSRASPPTAIRIPRSSPCSCERSPRLRRPAARCGSRSASAYGRSICSATVRGSTGACPAAASIPSRMRPST